MQFGITNKSFIHANRCGPCKMMHPVYEQLSNRYRDVMFLRCDGDKNRDISSSEGILYYFNIFIIDRHNRFPYF